MGYDIGFHAIDKKDVDSAIAYVSGKNDILDYLEKAGEVAKSRYIANAWGLASMKITEDFNSNLYIWGRPFFVTDNENTESIIKKYISANEVEANEIAKSQIKLLVSDESKFKVPDTSKMPSSDDFKHNASWKLNLFKSAFSAIKNDEKTIKDPNGNEHDPYSLFLTDFHLSLIDSIAYSSPTWMTRGHVWPSLLLADVAGNVDFFEPSSIFTKAIKDELTELRFDEDASIRQNYRLGGVVAPKNLDLFKNTITENYDKMLEKAKKEDWEEYLELALKKINECIDYCINNDLYFVESSDIYSAPMGIIS